VGVEHLLQRHESIGFTKRQFTSVTFSSSFAIARRVASTIVRPPALPRHDLPQNFPASYCYGRGLGGPINHIRCLVARITNGKRTPSCCSPVQIRLRNSCPERGAATTIS